MTVNPGVSECTLSVSSISSPSPVVWDNSPMHDDIAMTTGGYLADITNLGGNIFQIDPKMAGSQGITAGYLIRSSRPCLVETGTSTSAPVVRAGLASLGIEPADLATVVVTHIHLDHAGGVGDIASMFPSAEVFVNEKGARPLADPSRLRASARMVYGNALEVLFGELAAVPADRLRTLDDVGMPSTTWGCLTR